MGRRETRSRSERRFRRLTRSRATSLAWTRDSASGYVARHTVSIRICVFWLLRRAPDAPRDGHADTHHVDGELRPTHRARPLRRRVEVETAQP